MGIIKRLLLVLLIPIESVILIVSIFTFIWIIYYVLFDRNLINDISGLSWKINDKLW